MKAILRRRDLERRGLVAWARLFLLPVASSAVLTACGTMTVTMEVLNPEAIQRAQDKTLLASIPAIVGTSPDNIDLAVDALRSVHRRGYEAIAEQERVAAATMTAAQAKLVDAAADGLVTGFDRRTATAYADLKLDLKNIQKTLVATLHGKGIVVPTDLDYRSALDVARLWDQRLTEFKTKVKNDIRRTAASRSIAAPVAKDIVAATEAAVDNGVGQVSIQNSQYAFAVVSALNTDWHRYNEVLTYSRFGSSDVAIKLDPATGNYLLKGLLFDPSDVAAVAAKVGTQALLLAAQISGVPVKLSSTPAAGTNGAGLATSSGALVDAQATLETRRAQQAARQTALTALANVIINEENAVGDTDAAVRDAAAKAIRSAFDTRLPLLRPTASK